MVEVGYSSIPIENINPGDWVIAHDGQSHRVLRTIRKCHRGLMIGIRHNLNPQMLWVTGNHQVLCQRRTLSYGAQRTWKHVPREHFPRSRELRKDMTAAGHMLWRSLRGEQLGEVYDLEVEGAHTLLTDVCAVHNYGFEYEKRFMGPLDAQSSEHTLKQQPVRSGAMDGVSHLEPIKAITRRSP